MPSTKVERYVTVIREEDYVKFTTEVSHFLKRGWKQLSSGCNTTPLDIVKRWGKYYKVTSTKTVWWMILTKTERVKI